MTTSRKRKEEETRLRRNALCRSYWCSAISLSYAQIIVSHVRMDLWKRSLLRSTIL